MTNKEAIEILKAHISIYDCCKADHEANEAIDLAVKALKEKPQAEWIEFAQWVAKEVLDNYFEESSGAFAEIACRKLVKLGLVEVENNVYKMKGGAE